MAPKSDRDTFRTLHAETAKAVQRGEKFARSLKRVIAQRNPETALQPLLEAVKKGLGTLGAEADDLERIAGRKREPPRPEASASKPAISAVMLATGWPAAGYSSRSCAR
jgi:hypothetical protein